MGFDRQTLGILPIKKWFQPTKAGTRGVTKVFQALTNAHLEFEGKRLEIQP